MACLNICCPPHNFVAVDDPDANDCADSTVPNWPTASGYCTGSYWKNTITGQFWIGANDMACGTAIWLKVNTVPILIAGVATQLGQAQVIPTTTYTKLNYATELADTDNSYDAVNYIFTAPRTTKYLVQAHVQVTTTTGWEIGDRIELRGMVNGVTPAVMPGARWIAQHASGTGQSFTGVEVAGTRTYHLTAGDTVEIQIWHNNAGSITLNDTGSIMSIDEIPIYGVYP